MTPVPMNIQISLRSKHSSFLSVIKRYGAMMADAMMARSCSIWIGERLPAFNPLMKMLMMPHRTPAAMTDRVYFAFPILIFL